MNRAVEAVLLDADDTLYDTRSAMHHAGAAAAAAAWPAADPARLARAGVRFRADPRGHFRAYTRGELEFDEMRRARIDELADWLGQEPGARCARRFQARYEPEFQASLRAFPEARSAIAALRLAGYALGVLTNSSSRYTEEKMRAVGLEGLFDIVCTRDTLGFGKPHPGAFHEACRRLATAPRHTLHVGDELDTDPLGADDAGLRACWLVRERAPREPDAQVLRERGIPVVASLSEVVDLLAEGPGRFGVGGGGR